MGALTPATTVLDALRAVGSAPVSELMKVTKLDRAQVQRALGELAVEGLVGRELWADEGRLVVKWRLRV